MLTNKPVWEEMTRKNWLKVLFWVIFCYLNHCRHYSQSYAILE